MAYDRNTLLQQLQSYKASEFEADVVKELFAFVNTSPTCFERVQEEDAKHIAVSVLLTNKQNEALFLWHKKIKQWTQPGGHCDGDEDLLSVAYKELEEETGIKGATISPTPLEIRKYSYDKSVFGYSKSIYNITFLASLDSDETPRIAEPDKCGEMRWMNSAEARTEVSSSPYPNATHLIDKWELATR